MSRISGHIFDLLNKHRILRSIPLYGVGYRRLLYSFGFAYISKIWSLTMIKHFIENITFRHKFKKKQDRQVVGYEQLGSSSSGCNMSNWHCTTAASIWATVTEMQHTSPVLTVRTQVMLQCMHIPRGLHSHLSWRDKLTLQNVTLYHTQRGLKWARQAMYLLQRTVEAASRNHCCNEKTVNILRF